MNQKEKTEIEILAEKQSGCELAIKELTKSQEYFSGELKEIKNNHLHTIQETINLRVRESPLYLTLDFIKQTLNNQWKVMGIGFAILAIVMAIVR